MLATPIVSLDTASLIKAGQQVKVNCSDPSIFLFKKTFVKATGNQLSILSESRMDWATASICLVPDCVTDSIQTTPAMDWIAIDSQRSSDLRAVPTKAFLAFSTHPQIISVVNVCEAHA